MLNYSLSKFMGIARKSCRAALRSLGWDLERYAPICKGDLLKLLEYYQVDLVLDVGANEGQYAQSLLHAGFTGMIVSYEPLLRPHQELVKKCKHYPNWKVAERCALGDSCGVIEIRTSVNTECSSCLTVSKTVLEFLPGAQIMARELVPLRTLDIAAEKYIAGTHSPFLKIDVQGFEDKVLRGAEKILPLLAGLQVEMSLVTCYEGQVLFLELLDQIGALGMDLHHVIPVFADPKSGRLLQLDGIFFRAGCMST